MFHDKIRAVLVFGLSLWLVALPAPGGEAQASSRRLRPPLHGKEEVGWQNVALKGPFLWPRLEIHHKSTIPHVLNMLDESRHIFNSDVAAKVIRGETAGQATTDSDQATKALEGDAGNQNPEAPAVPAAAGLVGHRANLLNGVTVIHTAGQDGAGKPVTLTAIPHFAWGNRGKTPCTYGCATSDPHWHHFSRACRDSRCRR